MRPLDSIWLGTDGYAEALARQNELHESRASGAIPDTLVQLEHPHVFTIGRRGTRGDVVWDDDTLARRQVDVCEADRGGMVTYHGPGQLVGYPIIDLGPGADLVRYVRDLEESIMRALESCGVVGERNPGFSGVWVGNRKIAAIGVKVSRGVTKHGYAVNVSPDLTYFGGIVPCGIMNRGVTSIHGLTARAPDVRAFAAAMDRAFRDVFGFETAVRPTVVAQR